jgi:hypothetical protein
MMIVVAIAALDFAAIRALWVLDSRAAGVALLLVLPMVNVLASGILVAQQHPGSRSFLRGFVAFGGMALASCVVLSCYRDGTVMDVYIRLLSGPWEAIVGHPPSSDTDLTRALVVAAWVGWPQVTVALIGGFLSRGAARR